MIKILLTPEVDAKLCAATACIKSEFAGFGFVRPVNGNFEIYDFELLALGGWSTVKIQPKDTLPLMDRPDHRALKAWVHKHPMGNGVPGIHNWSQGGNGSDEWTIQNVPLGGFPEIIKWSISLVITPGGMVARFDDHVKHTVMHLEVESQLNTMLAKNALLAYDDDPEEEDWEDCVMDDWDGEELSPAQVSWLEQLRDKLL